MVNDKKDNVEQIYSQIILEDHYLICTLKV